MKFLFLLILSLFISSKVYAGPIYVYEQDGVIKFSSKPPPKGITAKVFEAKKSTFSTYRAGRVTDSLFLTKYADLIEKHARLHKVDGSLIRALIHAESSFNPKAISPKGALGLMQLMPSNLELLGVSDPMSPAENIMGGVKLLAMLLKKYEGNLKLTLAAYNAGEGAVEKYGGVPPYDETKDYISRVTALLSRYRVASNG